MVWQIKRWGLLHPRYHVEGLTRKAAGLGMAATQGAVGPHGPTRTRGATGAKAVDRGPRVP